MSDIPPSEDAFADFCADLPRSRRLLRGPVGRARRDLVERIVAAAREGAPVADLLTEPDPPRPAGDGGLPRRGRAPCTPRP
ncbi:hypothetical protein [Nocardiopsis protaetiae]|uniref:hypothetical protein n=1 Tax=Nocardiopsis protaetiae TaxID=3382270 RepID=UPI00387ADE5C